MAFSHLLQNHNGFFFHHYLPPPISSSSSSTTTTSTSLFPNSTGTNGRRWKTNRTSLVAAATTGSNPLWVDAWKPDNSPSPPLSDIFWPSAAIGVLAFSLLGPGWLARSTALAASIAFMIYTRSNHPPAASLPLLFIDGAKLHGLNYWYALFPEAAGCLILCFLVSWFGWLYV
ncbi:hypothetical protein LINPERPRIM_LOCUS11254 [Linum perenne]